GFVIAHRRRDHREAAAGGGEIGGIDERDRDLAALDRGREVARAREHLAVALLAERAADLLAQARREVDARRGRREWRGRREQADRDVGARRTDAKDQDRERPTRHRSAPWPRSTRSAAGTARRPCARAATHRARARD